MNAYSELEQSVHDVYLCACSLIPESVPSNVITDLSTLCALDPPVMSDESCLSKSVAFGLKQAYVWRASQVPERACPAVNWDSKGPCGDADVVVTFGPVCAHVAYASDSPGVTVTVTPFVSPEMLSLHTTAIDKRCTRDELASSSGIVLTVKCADRKCMAATVIESHQTTCTSSSGLYSTSFICGEEGFVADSDSSGCTTGTIVSQCSELSPAHDGVTAIRGRDPCVPNLRCSTACDRQSGPCAVQGVRSDGTPCKVACHQEPTYFSQVLGECITDICGSDGLRTVSYVACTASGQSGCLAYIDPSNTTTSCVSAPCPCESGADCLPKAGVVYTAISAFGDPCPSSTIDTGGRCCNSTSLDPCGMCFGEAYAGFSDRRIGLDSRGECCTGAAAILTRSLECCESVDKIDACGVCLGTGDTCALTIPAPLAPGVQSDSHR